MAVVIGGVIGGAGCSLAAMERPPFPTEREPTCTSSPAPIATDLLLGVGTLLAGAAFFVFVGQSEADNADALVLGTSAVALAGTATFLTSAVIGVGRADDCRTARREWVAAGSPRAPAAIDRVERVPDVPLVEAVAARDPLAAQLTLQAHTAALRKRCEPIPSLAARVRKLDPEYYERVFAVDPAIKSCRD